MISTINTDNFILNVVCGFFYSANMKTVKFMVVPTFRGQVEQHIECPVLLCLHQNFALVNIVLFINRK